MTTTTPRPGYGPRNRFRHDVHDPTFLDRLPAHRDAWIANALSCEPADRARATEAIRGLYRAAALTPPPPEREVFVRSPFTAHIAGGVAAGVWWLRDNPDRHGALFGRQVSDVEVMAAVPLACAVAVDAGMAVLEGRPRRVFLPPATTRDATDAATDAATAAATYAATDDATAAALAAATFMIRCTSLAWRMHNGGSDWSAWPAYLSFFDRIAGLDLDMHPKWRHYEQAASASASRIIHERFWIASDRHTIVHTESAGGALRRLHCADGPARAWADGWALWYWHGTRVPADLVETGWDTPRILREQNTEVRRCAIERLGWDQFIAAAGLQQVGDTVADPGNPGQGLALYDVPEQIYGDADVRVLLCTNGTVERDGTRRRFGLTVPADITDPIAAAAWGYGITPDLYATAARRA